MASGKLFSTMACMLSEKSIVTSLTSRRVSNGSVFTTLTTSFIFVPLTIEAMIAHVQHQTTQKNHLNALCRPAQIGRPVQDNNAREIALLWGAYPTNSFKKAANSLE